MLRNTLAHLGGRGFSSVAGLLITTVITARLGAAAMGIFGIYMVLQNMAGVLDGGMAITLNRVMAIGTLGQTKDRKHLQLFRTFEVINGGIGAIFALGTMLFLPWLIAQWGTEHTENFDLQMIAVFFGIALAIRFMQTLYHNALFGAHQHFAANAVIGCFSIVRSVGVLTAIFYLHGNLATVFMAIAGSNAFEIIALMAACRARGLWRLRVLPHWHMLKEYSAVMAPVSGYTIVGVILSQLDRVIVGHFVTLEQFGAYSLIGSYAGGITALAYAPANVFFPTITQAVHNVDMRAAKQAVKNALSMILLLTFPAAIWAMFYGNEIGRVMFSSPDVLNMTQGLWGPLFLNCCIGSLTLIPYKILLAEDRAKDILKVNLMLLIFYPALLYVSLTTGGYPIGLYAIPVLTATLLAQYLYQIGKSGEIQKQFIRDILEDGFVLGVIFTAIFAACHAFLLPPGLSRLATVFYAGAPVALVGLAYAYWAIARPRLAARKEKS